MSQRNREFTITFHGSRSGEIIESYDWIAADRHNYRGKRWRRIHLILHRRIAMPAGINSLAPLLRRPPGVFDVKRSTALSFSSSQLICQITHRRKRRLSTGAFSPRGVNLNGCKRIVKSSRTCRSVNGSCPRLRLARRAFTRKAELSISAVFGHRLTARTRTIVRHAFD